VAISCKPFTFSTVIFELEDGTEVSWLTGNERVEFGVGVGEIGGISVAGKVTGTWVTVGMLSEASGAVVKLEELQAEIRIVKIKIMVHIFFNVFLHVAIYKYQNADTKPACLKISATCSALRP